MAFNQEHAFSHSCPEEESWQGVPGILKTVIVAINSVGSDLGYNVQEVSK